MFAFGPGTTRAPVGVLDLVDTGHLLQLLLAPWLFGSCPLRFTVGIPSYSVVFSLVVFGHGRNTRGVQPCWTRLGRDKYYTTV